MTTPSPSVGQVQATPTQMAFHAAHLARRGRLWGAEPPPAKPARTRPVSPFERQRRARLKAQREAFDRQMRASLAMPSPEAFAAADEWAAYVPPAPYDECVPPSHRRPTMKEIIDEVALKHRLNRREIQSSHRYTEVVIARQEAMWRCRNETNATLPQIGRAMGNRDHTTVLYGIRKHEERMREAAQ